MQQPWKKILSLLGLSILSACSSNAQINEADSTSNSLTHKDSISIAAVGDVMLGSNYPSIGFLPDNDHNILKEASPILKGADIAVGNLEGTLFDSGGSPKSCSDPSICYVFRMPSHYGKYLVEAGFDFLSIANNHSNDFGDEGRAYTMKNLDELGIKYAGLTGKAEQAFLDKNGTKYGFVSFAPNSGTVNINDLDNATRLIRDTKQKSDIVIVMFHGGAERASHQHIPRKNEIFYGENRGDVFKFARNAVNAGADIVFGQGPHVVRAIELYKGKFISYSGGNFATYGAFNIKGPNGLAPIFKIDIDKKGNFLSGQIYPFIQYGGQNGMLGTLPDKNNTVIKKIIELNKSDFPEGNGLSVSPDGMITKK